MVSRWIFNCSWHLVPWLWKCLACSSSIRFTTSCKNVWVPHMCALLWDLHKWGFCIWYKLYDYCIIISKEMYTDFLFYIHVVWQYIFNDILEKAAPSRSWCYLRGIHMEKFGNPWSRLQSCRHPGHGKNGSTLRKVCLNFCISTFPGGSYFIWSRFSLLQWRVQKM